MESSFLTGDQALSPWSVSTDSKTLDYQRTNPRECQVVRPHTWIQTTWIQDLVSPNYNSTLCRILHLNNKQYKNTNKIIRRQNYHLTQPCPSEEKQKTNKNSAQISPYMKLTQTTGTTLRGQKPKGRKNSTFSKENSTFLEVWEKETSNTIS